MAIGSLWTALSKKRLLQAARAVRRHDASKDLRFLSGTVFEVAHPSLALPRRLGNKMAQSGLERSRKIPLAKVAQKEGPSSLIKPAIRKPWAEKTFEPEASTLTRNYNLSSEGNPADWRWEQSDPHQDGDVPLQKRKLTNRVKFEDGLPRRSTYRRFKLSTKLLAWDGLCTEDQDGPVRQTAAFAASDDHLQGDHGHLRTEDDLRLEKVETGRIHNQVTNGLISTEKRSHFKSTVRKDDKGTQTLTYSVETDHLKSSAATLKRQKSPRRIEERVNERDMKHNMDFFSRDHYAFDSPPCSLTIRAPRYGQKAACCPADLACCHAITPFTAICRPLPHIPIQDLCLSCPVHGERPRPAADRLVLVTKLAFCHCAKTYYYSLFASRIARPCLARSNLGSRLLREEGSVTGVSFDFKFRTPSCRDDWTSPPMDRGQQYSDIEWGLAKITK